MAVGAPGTTSHSTQEYFDMLLPHAERAGERGDYGISAAFVVRRDGKEIISVGLSTVVTEADPLGHAEVNAIRNMQRLLSSTTHVEVFPWGELRYKIAGGGGLFLREYDDRTVGSNASLYATLEPCPMCTVAILNSPITSVVIANPDETAGSLLDDRFRRLPDAWPGIADARGLSVEHATSDVDDPMRRLSKEVSGRLEAAFKASQPSADDRLRRSGAFDIADLHIALKKAI